MKNKLYIILILLIILTLTGCSNKVLTCNVEEQVDGRKTNSTLTVNLTNDEITNMELTMIMTIPDSQTQYKQMMIEQIKKKTNQVYSTPDGLKAIFDMNSDYFNGLGLSKDVSYDEIKEVLEVQGYTCK